MRFPKPFSMEWRSRRKKGAPSAPMSYDAEQPDIYVDEDEVPPKDISADHPARPSHRSQYDGYSAALDAANRVFSKPAHTLEPELEDDIDLPESFEGPGPQAAVSKASEPEARILPDLTQTDPLEAKLAEDAAKPRRGRKPKQAAAETAAETATETNTIPKRGRGRPKKDPNAPVVYKFKTRKPATQTPSVVVSAPVERRPAPVRMAPLYIPPSSIMEKYVWKTAAKPGEKWKARRRAYY